MNPLPSTTAFFDYIDAKYGTLSTNIKPEPTTFTHSELQTMNHGSLWRGCIVLPTSTISNSYTLMNTGAINGNMDKIYTAIPK